MSEKSGSSKSVDRPSPESKPSEGSGTTGQRLSNLFKLYHVPVFALRELLASRVPGHSFSNLRQTELVAEADKHPQITEQDIEDLYESYRYGHRLAFYLYLLPPGLEEPGIDDLQQTIDELAAQHEPGLDDEIAASEDYESETSPDQLVLIDKEDFDNIVEIRYRYYTVYRFLNVDEQPDQVLQVRYGFLWLDLELGYLALHSRDDWVNRLLVRALANWFQAIPLPVRLGKELVDQHFSIEKIRRVSHYDPGTGVRQSLSGRGLWKAYDEEIQSRERRYTRPSSLYEEEVASGMVSGLGVTASKGKIYLTRTLPTSVVRSWALQRLPNLIRDLQDLRVDDPGRFNRSLESINRMRLPAKGKAAVIDIVEALLHSEREALTDVDLSWTASAIYDALAGKYFDPYLRIQCHKCEEIAELCPHCESHDLNWEKHRVTCDECGAVLSNGESVALRCMNGHINTALETEAFGIAPNHWMQKRMARIFTELGLSWEPQIDYFHLEGSTLYRLRKGELSNQLPNVVQNYVNNFWESVSGQIHTGGGDIYADGSISDSDTPSASAEKQPEEHPSAGPFETYESFDLRLRGSAAAGYTVEAAASAGGSEPPQSLTLPQSNEFQRQLDNVLRQTASGQDIQGVGGMLFQALFPRDILKLWSRTVGSLKDKVGLHLRLYMDSPELMALPWELLFEEEFLGLRPRFPVVRYLDHPEPPRSTVVQPPLRVLAVVAEPADQPSLDVDTELANIQRAIRPLQGRIEMDVIENATRDELLSRLRQGYQVLHFIGHGVFDGNEGHLIFADERGRSDPVSALLLGRLVADTSLVLATLNACESSATGLGKTLGGVAHQLVGGGMPAVVAMQMALADRSAVAFSRGFFGSLAQSWPIEAAVQEGRRSVLTEFDRDWNQRVDWAIPTLYMRAPHGVVLEQGAERVADGE